MKQWIYKSPIGDLIILSQKNRLKGLWFCDQKFVGQSFDLENIPTELSNMNQKVVI